MSGASSEARPDIDGHGKWAGRRISQEEAREVVDGHFLFLKRRRGGIAAILTSSDLSGLDLSHATLTEAKFTGANLSGAKLIATTLDRASLMFADLRNCDLRYATMIGADARGASLKGADLTRTTLDGADFRSAVMFRHENGDRVRAMPETEHADGGVDFSGASLKGASFAGAVLKDVNFSNALLQGTHFRGASVVNACLRGAVLTDVSRNDLPFSDDELLDCILEPDDATISRANALLPSLYRHVLWVESGSAQGAPARLDGEDLRPFGDALMGRQLTALSAARARGIGVNFSDCELQGANFRGADLRDAKFLRTDLRGANFEGADLSHASFDGANLGMLELEGDRRIAVNLDNAIFTETQFIKARRAA
jgi:uncharacterized protein YjbI with pentapeptide repeats